MYIELNIRVHFSPMRDSGRFLKVQRDLFLWIVFDLIVFNVTKLWSNCFQNVTQPVAILGFNSPPAPIIPSQKHMNVRHISRKTFFQLEFDLGPIFTEQLKHWICVFFFFFNLSIQNWSQPNVYWAIEALARWWIQGQFEQSTSLFKVD